MKKQKKNAKPDGYSVATEPAIFVFRTPGRISQKQAMATLRSFAKAVKGTPFARYPAVCMGDAMTVECVTFPPQLIRNKADAVNRT